MSVVITGSMMASPIGRDALKCQARLTFNYKSSFVENLLGAQPPWLWGFGLEARRISGRVFIAGEAFATMMASPRKDYSVGERSAPQTVVNNQ